MTEFGTLEMVTDPEVKKKEVEAGIETSDPAPAQSPTPPPEGKSDTAPVPPANQTKAGSSKGKSPLDQGPQYLSHWIKSVMSRETFQMFEHLPSGKHKTQRMTNRLFPQAVRLLEESDAPKPTTLKNRLFKYL
jgi:hypothetical protein